MVDDDGLRNSLSADDSNDLFFEDSGEYSPGIIHIKSRINSFVFDFHRFNVVGHFDSGTRRQISHAS